LKTLKFGFLSPLHRAEHVPHLMQDTGIVSGHGFSREEQGKLGFIAPVAKDQGLKKPRLKPFHSRAMLSIQDASSGDPAASIIFALESQYKQQEGQQNGLGEAPWDVVIIYMSNI
jgi:hypothetical protein